jgi:di/tricarboxylate transporter
MLGMDSEIVLSLGILFIAVVFFVTEKLRVDLVALLVLLALALTGLLDTRDALSGFSHPAVLTVIAAFIIGEGLFQTGLAQLVGRYVMRIAGSNEIRLTVVIMASVAGASALIDNVGATAVMLPVVMGLARQNRIPPSKLLIPLSFGALHGGLLSLMGRPSNIVVSDALREYTGEPFGMFDFTPIGLILMSIGVLYMLFIGRRLLPERAVEDKLAAMMAAQRKSLEMYQLGERMFEVRVLPESPLVDLALDESHLGRFLGLTVVGIVREGHTILRPNPNDHLKADDLLLIQGLPDQVVRLRWTRGVEIEQELAHWQPEDIVSPDLALVEAVLTTQSSFIGHTLREMDFRRKYGLTVLAIWRDSQPRRTGLASIPLKFGDTLLIQGTRANIHLLSQQPDLLVLGDEAETGETRTHRAPLAALLLLLMIGIIALDVAPVAIGTLLAATLMVLFGCLTLDDAYAAIEWKAVFLMAGMLPMGLALEQSGTARFLAERVIDLVGGFGNHGILAGMFVFTLVASQLMSSVAAAVLITPIAYNAALSSDANPQAFLMAVAVAGSFAFITPISHQANVLVMGPGGYKFTDYARVGLPLAILLCVIAIIILPWLWPL